MNVIGKKVTWMETGKQTFQMSQFSGSPTCPLCPVGTFRNRSKTRRWLVERLDAHQWRSWWERDRRRVLQVLDKKTSRFRLWCVLWDSGRVRFWTLQIEAKYVGKVTFSELKQSFTECTPYDKEIPKLLYVQNIFFKKIDLKDGNFGIRN